MIFAKINVRGNRAALTEGKPLTSGTVGARVELSFDEAWEGLDKILVWQSAGGVWTDRECTGIIPPQALARGGEKLLMGICGWNGDRVLPTVWADLGMILQGAGPEGEPQGEQALPLWAQVLEELEELKTQGGTGGKDGISAAHSWDGTVLTITSAAGTSSADLKGEKGDTGATGPQGEKGDKGDTGTQGPKGDKGDQGIRGEQGPQGEPGAKGDQGDPGADGENGISSTVTISQGKETDGRNNLTVQSTITLPDGTVTVSEGKVVDGAKGDKGDTGAQGPKGDKGDKGDTGAQGNPGKDGANGKDGVSATHSWNGTTLTITSASGTSSANLKGEKGDKGDQGIPGEKGDTGAPGSNGTNGKDGANGTSVTVKSVSESTADGGSNVVTFSDGKTITIKNGSKGSKGDTGATGATGATGSKGDKGDKGDPGDDYVLTAGDKAEIASLVIETLGGSPIFGVVDSNNNIVVSGNLPDGTYSVKYEMENGNTVNIGNLVIDTNVYYTVTNNLTQCTNSNSATQAIGGEPYTATITAKSGYELKSIVVKMGGTDISSTAVSGGKITISNVTGNIVITAAAEEIKAAYTNLADPTSADWWSNSRVGSDGTRKDETGYTVTNYIGPLNSGDIVRVKGMDFVTVPKASGTYDTSKKASSYGASQISNYNNGSVITDYTATTTGLQFKHVATGIKYWKLTGKLNGEASDVIITVNEPID